MPAPTTSSPTTSRRASGAVFLTGTQALVRLLLMQRRATRAAGLNTQGFVSGYRGSPLGMVDQQVWKAREAARQGRRRFLPAINEELGATAVLGTQRVESDPERTVEGVFAMWYGKGPGVDRAGDALKHGNAYGSSPHGGVLVVAGDDHGCVSSSMPHQSDLAMQAWQHAGPAAGQRRRVPGVRPVRLGAVALLGRVGRLDGAVRSGRERRDGRPRPDERARRRLEDGAEVAADTGFVPPADGLHYRWPDLPSLRIESRLADKLDAVRAFAKVNRIDRHVVVAPQATVGIVTCGKAHFDLMEVLRRLEISPDALAAAGVRLYKVGLCFPLEPTRIAAFAQG